MSDFLEALRRGVATAKVAIDNHVEIDGVLADASAQIQEFTDGRVTVYALMKKQAQKLEDIPERKTAEMSEDRYYLAPPKDVKEFLPFLVVRRHKEGYPSAVSYGDQTVQCFELQGFKSAVADALSSPEIGAKIISLM